MQLTHFARVGLVIGAIQAFTLSAQTFTKLAAFEGQGSNPYSAVVQAADGNFYGTTTEGGVSCASRGCGGVFKMTPAGELTLLYSFCAQAACADGSYPFAPLVEAPNGDFFGTTKRGGPHANGTIFKITQSGELTTLYSFCLQPACADGAGPVAGLVRSANGDLYGTTYQGGAAEPQCGAGCGTVFRITPTGALTTLYSFCTLSACADGATPVAALIRAQDGNFYGTTSSGGGAQFNGTVFKISARGALNAPSVLFGGR